MNRHVDVSFAPDSVQPEIDRHDPVFEDFQDPHKVFHHLDRVMELRETGDTRPVHMTIGFTNYCNHKYWNQAGRASERSGAEDRKRKSINAPDRLIEAVGEATAMGLKAVTPSLATGNPPCIPGSAPILTGWSGWDCISEFFPISASATMKFYMPWRKTSSDLASGKISREFADEHYGRR